MKILNRGFISVVPKPNFIKEFSKHEKGDHMLMPNIPEATIYLIEEDFWDDEIVLKKYYKKIIEAELRQIDSDKKTANNQFDSNNFHSYFEISMGNLVFDLENKSIEQFTDDESS